MHTSPVRIVLITAATTLACSGDASVSPDGPGLHFLSAVVSDTIDAVVATPVELRLNDDRGVPRGGAAVTIAAPQGVSVTRVATSLGGTSLPTVTVTTDADGRARVWVKVGGRVGREWIRATADAATDSLGVDILAGQPASVTATPSDTAIWVGQSYALRAKVLDRRSNPRSDAVQFSATGPVAVSSGGTVTASAIGRATIVASAGTRSTTVATSVVPQGTLGVLAVPEGAGQAGGIYTIRTDGSGGRWILRFTSASAGTATASATQVGTFGIWPTWCADANRLVFTQAATLRIVNADGSGLRDVVVGAGSLPVSEEFPPECSRDGWIYFTRGQFGNQRTFWRVRPDGTGLAQVSEKRDWGIEAMPSPNPAGDVVAYQTNDATNSPIGFELRFLSTVNGTIRKFAINGYSPRWSPTGSRVAYLNNPDRLNLLDANGAPLGEVGGRVVPLQKGFSWSPDGEWVIGVGTLDGLVPVLKMVNVTSGLALPLVFRGPERQLLDQPSWQPAR